MVNNGWVEPASPVPASGPATESAPAENPATVPPARGATTPLSEEAAAPLIDGPAADGPVAEPSAGGSAAAPLIDGPAAAPSADAVAAVPLSDEAVAAAPTKEGRSLKDMVMSLAVLVVPIALLLIFYRVVLSGDAPVTVDPAATIQEAQAVFPVAVPAGLGDDWHVTTATFKRQPNGATLRLGYADPDKDPIQLVESTVPTASLLPIELSKSAKPLENFRAANGVWRLYDGRPGEQALVLTDRSRTIIVVGRTDVRNLRELASSLS
jgi:uncharacterized protein DUF4245